MGYSHYKLGTIAAGQCGGSDTTDYLLRLSVTDPDFAGIAFGGKMQNGSGFDGRPYSALFGTPYTYKLLHYVTATGQIIMDIKVPVLSHTVDGPVYFALGDSSLTSDGSSNATYSNGYLAAYPFIYSGGVLSLSDVTGNGNTLTNNGATTTSGPNGGFAVSLNGSSDLTRAGLVTAAPLTVEYLFNTSDVTIDMLPWGHLRTDLPFGNWEGWYSDSFGADASTVVNNFSVFGASSGSGGRSNGVWYPAMAVFASASSRKAYVLGVPDTVNTTTVTPDAGGAYAFTIGASYRGFSTDGYFTGSIADMIVSNVARSDDYAIQRSNNLRPSSDFISWGALTPVVVDALEWRGQFPIIRGLHARAVNVGY